MHTISGLYLITDAVMLEQGSYGSFLDLAMQNGLRIVQLRAKNIDRQMTRAIAHELREMTQRHNACFLINDDLDLALDCGADGVHVGQDDISPEEARRRLGPDALIGLSTHTAEQVRDSMRRPIDYIGFGPVFATQTKENPDPVVGVEGLRRAVEEAKRPVVAIGGITLDNLGPVLAAGAAGVAVISAISRAADPVRAVCGWIDRINAFTAIPGEGGREA